MTMSLKVLNKVNLDCLPNPELFHITDFLLFTRLLELLAINHNLSERRISFVPWLLKFPMFWLFYNLHKQALPRS